MAKKSVNRPWSSKEDHSLDTAYADTFETHYNLLDRKVNKIEKSANKLALCSRVSFTNSIVSD